MLVALKMAMMYNRVQLSEAWPVTEILVDG
jgi:hypothetical protein